MTILVITILYSALLEFLRSQLKHALQKPLLKNESGWPSVTVVVPFRNEKNALPALIRSLSEQIYPGPQPQIILVDDHSTDIEGEFALPEHFRMIQLANDKQGKKQALALGIEKASSKWIVTTDADVTLSKNWLSSLLHQAEETNAVMICGSVDVQSGGGFLQNFQQMETAILQGAGMAMLEAGVPFLNSGTSLAFRKDAWEKVGGYSSHEQFASGDDVFLMFDMNKQFPGRVISAFLPGAAVKTQPVKTISALLRQRVRWTSKMRGYSSIPVLLIAVVVLLSAFGVIFALLTQDFTLLLTLLFLRGFSELRLLKSVRNSVEMPSLFYRLLMVVVYPIYLMVLTLAVIVYKPSWKGR
jgi:cellulose synthase/poly-beta-1,6-N-acetylglucosamine synthase-like glycosyltransferase